MSWLVDHGIISDALEGGFSLVLVPMATGLQHFYEDGRFLPGWRPDDAEPKSVMNSLLVIIRVDGRQAAAQGLSRLNVDFIV